MKERRHGKTAKVELWGQERFCFVCDCCYLYMLKLTGHDTKACLYIPGNHIGEVKMSRFHDSGERKDQHKCEAPDKQRVNGTGYKVVGWPNIEAGTLLPL